MGVNNKIVEQPRLLWSPVFRLGVLCLFMASAIVAEAGGALTIWFDEPARSWEREGLPIGNGAMGALIQGGLTQEVLQFNEKTLWTGGPGSRQGYDFGLPENSQVAALQKVRRMLADQGQLSPETVAELLGRDPKGYGNYQTFGNLLLDFDKAPAPDEIKHYRRELDIGRALARVTYQYEGVVYTREYFASWPAGAIVLKLSASEPGNISFVASLDIPDNRSLKIQAEEERIIVSGQLHDNGLKYEAQLLVKPQGGNMRATEAGALAVEGADSAVLILAAGTNYISEYPHYRGDDPHRAVQARIDRARQQSWNQLLSEHMQDFQRLFHRVSLDIGQQMPDIPIPDLLANHAGKSSPAGRALENLYFQFGRYLLIASSREGSLPANLQGVWNNSNTPPWNADYHVNINLQMNYWPADLTNLSETAEPYFAFVESLMEPGRESAERIFGADGWTLFLNTNPWGFTGLISWPTAFWQPEAGAWLAHLFYDHYLFTRDEKFLRERAYPLMKGAAELWLDALVEDPRDQSLVVSPSFSPEHGNFTMGAAMSQQLVFDLFTNTLEAAQLIGDRPFGKQLEAVLVKLDPGLRIGSWGQLQEWKLDRDDLDNKHRHVSHLFALHPGNRISPIETPHLAEAARTSLDARGDDGTGWSKAWKINFWARLLDGNRAHKLLGEQLKTSTLPNLWDNHPPFQIDGNFGATAGIAEMLLQSHNGEIHLLPALPDAWPTGHLEGLRARGDVTVDLWWSDGELEKATLKAGQTGPVSVRSALFDSGFTVIETESQKPVKLKGEGRLRLFTATAGAAYELQRLKR